MHQPWDTPLLLLHHLRYVYSDTKKATYDTPPMQQDVADIDHCIPGFGLWFLHRLNHYYLRKRLGQ